MTFLLTLFPHRNYARRFFCDRLWRPFCDRESLVSEISCLLYLENLLVGRFRFWYFDARNKPDTAPLTLLLNGGTPPLPLLF
jgi:hypothetical protein